MEDHSNNTSMESADNVPLTLGCIMDDLAQVKEMLSQLSANLGIGAANLRPIGLKEAAAYLQISDRSLKNMVKERSIPYYSRAGKIYFFEKELLEWVKESRCSTFAEELAYHQRRYMRKCKQ